MTERKLPDDRELEQYLEGASPLSRRYRDASAEGSPPELDEAILAQARAELKRKPPSLNRYLAPVALAASVVLGVNLAWNLYQVEPVPAQSQRLEKAAAPEYVPEPPPAAQGPAPAASPPEVARRAPAAPPAKLEEKLAEKRASEADATAAVRERELELAAAQEKDRAAAQSGPEERAAIARRSEAESSRREMLQAQDAAGTAAPSAAPGSDPLESMARKASDARAMLPPGWYLLGAADRYEAAVDESIYRSAPSSLVLWRSAPGVDHCGRLETAVPSAGLAGKTVRLKAAVRTQGAQRVSLFVSYSRTGQVQWPLATREVTAAAGAWSPQEMTHAIPQAAERVVYGALLCGAGTLWLDDVELNVVTGPAAQAAGTLSESAKIDQLIGYVSRLSGAIFIRNGKEHSAEDAAEHMQLKRGKAGERCDTAEEFIRVCASFSSRSGEAYLIRFPDGRTRTAEDVLRERLATMENR